MRYRFTLCSVCLLVVSSTAYSQQISPNPNPVGNTITVDTSRSNRANPFTNDGEIVITGAGTLTNDGTLMNTGVLTNDGTLNSEVSLVNYNWLKNTINGTFQTKRLVTYGTLTNAGTLTNNDTLINRGSLDNSPFGRLNNKGTLDSFDTLINNGTLTNNGRLSSEGKLTNHGGVSNEIDGTWNNYGTLNNNGTLTNNGTLVHNGTIDTVDGTFVNDGTLTADGYIKGSYTDHGHTNPGNSAGVMTIDGDYFKVAGSVEIELGGLLDGGGDKSATQYDWIDVTGNVELAGTLDVQLIGEFIPQPDDSFNIFRIGGTLTGQYDGLDEGSLVGNFSGQDCSSPMRVATVTT